MIQSEDVLFLKKVLPSHYSIEIEKDNCIHCKSSIGIQDNGKEDEEHWGYIFKAIKNHFKERFSEVYSHTCTYKLDFCVYIKRTKTAV